MKEAKLNIRNFSVQELMESKAKYNPRDINSGSKNGLRHSLDKFGYVAPLVYNERTKTLVSGHQRLDILFEENYDNVDVNIVNVDLKNEKLMNIALNSGTISGQFNEKVNDLLRDILEYDIESFDTMQLDLLLMDDDEQVAQINDEEESKDIVKGMALMPYESYDAILVVFKKRDDFMFMSSKLGLGEKKIISSAVVQNKKLGYTRCVDGKDLIKAMKNEEIGFDFDTE